jgi:hypothetical protein
MATLPVAMGINPYQPPTSTPPDAPAHPSPSRIRPARAVLLGWQVLNFLVGLHAYFLGPLADFSIQPLHVFQTFLDLAIFYGLYGFVTYKRIGHIVLRGLYMVLVLAIMVRVSGLLYFFVPTFFPWTGRPMQYASIFILANIPFTLLGAYGLWLYAT